MTQFLHASGTKIVNADNLPIRLQGFAFGNEVWNTDEVPLNHHSEIDYERLQGMGMNAIRFYLNYRTFEEDIAPYTDKAEGWKWLDQNIAWAKKYGIYLVLNLHIAPGGFQSLGDGDGIWNETNYQDRIAAFWLKIAKRYHEEPQIAGYGLLNEPVPTKSILQWQQFAQRLVDDIRTVDKNHIIFVERTKHIKGDFIEDENLNFPIIEDDNVVYEFHTYQPYLYTHQLIDWAGLGDEGRYPDTNISEYIIETEGYDNSKNTAYKRDKNYLQAVLDRYVNWSNQKQVPLYMGEFGTCVHTFKNNKGGLQWIKDILDIANEHQLSYTCHAYHEDTYAAYFDSEHLPDPEKSNKELIKVLTIIE